VRIRRSENQDFLEERKSKEAVMNNRVEKMMKLMEELGVDLGIPEEFEYDSPDDENMYEWDDLEGGGMKNEA
jgi:hypothetical protein